jgi:hypothetical protein
MKSQAAMLGKYSRQLARTTLARLIVLLFAASVAMLLRAQEPASTPSSASARQSQSTDSTGAPALPRGKKLMLKDGGLQLVREYAIQGDRVHYYSIERSQWEDIPAAIVDWDATRKIAEEEAKRDATLVNKLHKQEEAHRIAPLDVDASLEVAPSVFLPQGEGLFAFDGKTVTLLKQAATDTNLSKRRLTEQILIPIHVIPSLTKVSVNGSHAGFRVKTGQPEFYLRVADQTKSDPEVELIQTKVHGGSREIENIDQLFKEQQITRDTLAMQRWEVARGVYRFTLGQTLDPGEYALIQIVEDNGMNLYVWDFGVDAAAKK